MVTVLIRTLLIYFMLLIALRLTGKRQVGELQISELVITFMISELATSPIQDLSIPLIYSVIPIIFLLCAEIILSFLATKSTVLKKMFFGNPSVIIKNGVLDQKELGRLRMGINELLGELRLKDVSDIEDVEYAIFEENGKLSITLKSAKQPLCPDDVKISSTEKGIAHPVVTDGTVNQNGLMLSGKNEEWLKHYLHKKKIDISTVFLMTVNDQGKINIINKEEK